jgi:hypothetical protein
MQFITLLSYDTENIIRLYEESGIVEDPAQFTESEHRTYQKVLAIAASQKAKHHRNLASGPKQEKTSNAR